MFKDNPALLKEMRERDMMEMETKISFFLHEQGYTFFNQNALTYVEILTLMNGAIMAENARGAHAR